MKKIHETVRDMREDRDLRQKDVAEFLDLSRTTYNHYELGHTSFTVDMIIKLAKLFDTTPNVLLNFDTSSEISDPDLIRLCKIIKKERIDTATLLQIINLSKNLRP